MGTTKVKPDPYNFDPAVERAAILLCCSDPRFFARLGHAIDPEALSNATGALAITAAKALAADLGQGPASPRFVLQHMRRMMNEGKATIEQVGAVAAYLDEAEDAFPPLDPDQIVGTLAPILRGRAETDALKRGFDAYANRAPDTAGRVIDLMQAAQRIGEADTSRGIEVGALAMGIIDAAKLVKRLSTGVLELDDLLGGGSVQRELGVVSLATGRGKSLTLCQFASQGVWEGRHVAVASTEVDEPTWLARMLANLTGIPIDQIERGAGTPGYDRCAKTLGEHRDRFGPCTIKYFTGGATAVSDIRNWTKDLAEQNGRPVELLVVDSADDLIAVSKKEIPGHERVKLVYTQLRALIHDELRCWGWTASQPKGAPSTGRARKRIDTDDLADGMGKARVCDKLLVASVDDDQSTIDFWLPKNRTGKARRSTGPIPVDFACGTVGPVVRFAPGGAIK